MNLVSTFMDNTLLHVEKEEQSKGSWQHSNNMLFFIVKQGATKHINPFKCLHTCVVRFALNFRNCAL